MNRTKFLVAIIIGLCLANAFLFFSRPPFRDGGPKDVVIKKLHFDSQQVKAYEGFIQKHREAVRENEAKMNAVRKKLYEQLKFDAKASRVDSLILTIAEGQKKAEQINYLHFLEIKKLCKPHQMNDFDHFTGEIVQLFSPKERK